MKKQLIIGFIFLFILSNFVIALETTEVNTPIIDISESSLQKSSFFIPLTITNLDSNKIYRGGEVITFNVDFIANKDCIVSKTDIENYGGLYNRFYIELREGSRDGKVISAQIKESPIQNTVGAGTKSGKSIAQWNNIKFNLKNNGLYVITAFAKCSNRIITSKSKDYIMTQVDASGKINVVTAENNAIQCKAKEGQCSKDRPSCVLGTSRVDTTSPTNCRYQLICEDKKTCKDGKLIYEIQKGTCMFNNKVYNIGETFGRQCNPLDKNGIVQQKAKSASTDGLCQTEQIKSICKTGYTCINAECKSTTSDVIVVPTVCNLPNYKDMCIESRTDSCGKVETRDTENLQCATDSLCKNGQCINSGCEEKDLEEVCSENNNIIIYRTKDCGTDKKIEENSEKCMKTTMPTEPTFLSECDSDEDCDIDEKCFISSESSICVDAGHQEQDRNRVGLPVNDGDINIPGVDTPKKSFKDYISDSRVISVSIAIILFIVLIIVAIFINPKKRR